MEFRVLGVLEALVDGQSVALGGPKQRSVLAALLVARGSPVSSDRLIDDVWTDAQGSARSLQVYVSELRRALRDPSRIVAVAGGYRLVLAPDELDAERFAALAAEADRLAHGGRDVEAAARYRSALAMWRGHAYADLAGEAFLAAEVARLEELRLSASERWIQAELAAGRHAAVLTELEALVAAEPLRERLRGLQMVALYRQGRQADALAVYHKARKLLRGELGIEPGPDLGQLYSRILRQDPSLDVEPEEVARRRRLPAPATSLVGRRQEVDAVTTMLRADARLVTLTGPGGVGKTRIAIQAAHELADRFAGGVFFVPLAAIQDARLVADRIATALGVIDTRDPLDAIAQHAGNRDLLLVLDNFEQVEEAAPALAELLLGAPGARILVTSRHRLRLYGEHEFAVEPLELDQEAVPLFVRRAAATGRVIAADAAVREVCARLDRLPLAIELTAARVRDMSPADMAASMSALGLATEGPRDLPDRQQTLDHAIGWSYELLDPELQGRFASLSVFASFELPAAESVAGAGEPHLDELRRRSLLVADGGRYSMLATIREFAAARLGERPDAEEVRDRHARWHLAFAEGADAALQEGRETAAWLDRVEHEHDDLRAALDRLALSDPTSALRLAVALGAFWEWRGHIVEGKRQLDAALARTEGMDSPDRARALMRSGVFAHMRGDLPDASARLSAALGLARRSGDRQMTARALRNIGTVLKEQGDHERAQQLHEEARQISAEMGDAQGVSSSLINLADVALARGDDVAAKSFAQQSIDIARSLDHDLRLVASLLNLGFACVRLAQSGEAAGAYREALVLCEHNTYGEGAAHVLVGLAALAAERGDAREAAMLIGAADALLDEAGAVLESTERPLRQHALDLVRAASSDESLGAWLSEGQALTLAQAIAVGRRSAETTEARAGSAASEPSQAT